MGFVEHSSEVEQSCDNCSKFEIITRISCTEEPVERIFVFASQLNGIIGFQISVSTNPTSNKWKRGKKVHLTITKLQHGIDERNLTRI
jgi:hypothetical protein